MKKTVNFCGNCPFMYSEYDDFSDNFTDICTLSKFLNKKEYIISQSDGVDVHYENEPPKWCPLKEEKVELDFKPFSENRQKEINELKEKIITLSNDIDSDDEIDIDDERYSKLEKLNSELDLLFKNEDIDIDDFANELKNSVNQINEQIEELVKASEKLSDTFNDLGDGEDKD